MDINEKVKAKKTKILEKVQKLTDKYETLEIKLNELQAKENYSDTREMSLIEQQQKVEDQLEKITLYFFDETPNLQIPLKILEFYNIPLIKEEVTHYKNILKDTEYYNSFTEVKANEMNDYLKQDKILSKIINYRKIIEDDKLPLEMKIKRLNKWKFWNSKLTKDFTDRNSRYDSKTLKKNKLTFGDFVVIDRFHLLGLPFSIEVYSLGFKTRDDFIKKDTSVLFSLDGMGPKRIEKMKTFIEKIKGTENFDQILFKI